VKPPVWISRDSSVIFTPKGKVMDFSRRYGMFGEISRAVALIF
jgi:hypothetical protein